MSDSRKNTAENSVFPLLFRALTAVIDDEEGTFADPSSKNRMREAYLAATTTEQRAAFERAITNEENPDLVREVLESVQAECAQANTSITLLHDANFEVSSRDASLYTFLATEDAEATAHLEPPARLESDIEDGLTAGLKEDYERASDCFERALEAAVEDDGRFVASVLAAWAAFQCGEDDRALELVKRAASIETESIAARMIGVAISHPSTERFRSGALGIRLFLRHTIACPGDSSATLEIGYPTSSDPEWVTLTQPYVFPKLATRQTVRLRLTGTFDDFPQVHGYYVALGIVDIVDNTSTDVVDVLLSGPVTADAEERLELS